MSELLNAVNVVRAQARSCGGAVLPAVPALGWNNALANAAAAHSTDMASLNFFSHTSSNGALFSDRINAAGYLWSAIAENIAAGNSTAAATVDQWVNSPPHCQAMMSATYVELGGSCMFKAGTTYRYYWTIDLGRPR